MNTIKIPIKTIISSIHLANHRNDQGMENLNVENGIHSEQMFDPENYSDENTNEKVYQYRITELETALQTAREEAYQAGYDEGKEATFKETKRQMEDISEEFSAMVQSLKEQFDSAIERLNEPLLKFSTKIAEKIISRELRHSDDYNIILLNQLKQLLREFADQNSVILHVNPEQIGWVSGLDINQIINNPNIPNMKIVVNERLQPGDCLLESEDFIIDGKLSTRLDDLVDKILEKDVNCIN